MPRVPSDAAAHIGRRIHEIRRARSLTQDEVAVISGIDSSNVRAYESGRSMPSVHTLMRFADALGVEPADLLFELTLDKFVTDKEDGRRTRSVPK